MTKNYYVDTCGRIGVARLVIYDDGRKEASVWNYKLDKWVEMPYAWEIIRDPTDTQQITEQEADNIIMSNYEWFEENNVPDVEDDD